MNHCLQCGELTTNDDTCEECQEYRETRCARCPAFVEWGQELCSHCQRDEDEAHLEDKWDERRENDGI